MSCKSPFAIFKALQAIGEPKSVKKMKSGDLLVETISAVQSKSYLSAKTFLDSPLLVTPHKSLNSSRGVISEPDLLCSSETEILEGFSGQGVIRVRRITIKKEAAIIPTKHIILTFNSPKLPTTIKAGYLHCKIRPYIPNPLRCFKCQRFGHSQTSCRGQLTCSRCATVGHPSTDCTLEPKCVNCSELHTSDSKLCPKWKLEKQIQEIKTNKNISYPEARRLIVPQLSQTYAQVTKPTAISTTTQTDPNITKINCPPLQCLSPVSSTSSSMPVVSTSSSSTEAYLLDSASSIKPTTQTESRLPKPISTSATTPHNSLNTSASPLLTETCTVPTTFNKFAALSTEVQPSVPLPEVSSSSTISMSTPKSTCSVSETTTTTSNTVPSTSQVQDSKQNSKNRARKRKKVQKKNNETKIEIKMAPHKPRKSTPQQDSSDEDVIEYDPDEFDPDAYFKKYYNDGEYITILTPTSDKNKKR